MNDCNRTKYSVEQVNYPGAEKLRALRWFNSNGQKEAPAGLPAHIEFYPSGNVREMYWYKADKLHRENDLPAHVSFKDSPDDEVTWAVWSINGKEHREGDLPSCIKIDENDGRVCVLGFCRHGENSGAGSLPHYIWINPDGSTEDDGGYPIDVDLSRFQGELPRPPPIALPSVFQPT